MKLAGNTSPSVSAPNLAQRHWKGYSPNVAIARVIGFKLSQREGALMDIPKLPAFVGPDSPTADRMHWVRVPFDVVLGMYKESVLRVQRHHLRRAKEARHITGSDNPLHVNFLAARTADGKTRLIDGYTRITAILHEGKVAPAQVWLGVADCESITDAEKLYDAVDSRAAVKRGRDAFEEGLRRSGLLGKLTSPAFVRGQAVSAVAAAAGDRDIRKAVYELRKGIQVLDPISIRAGRSGLPAGALAALLVVASKEESRAPEVQAFAAAIQHPKEVPLERRKELEAAFKCAEALKHRREANALSGKNVEPIMELVLGYWEQHSGRGGPRATPVKRDEYLATAA
ncbi:MULTISPECIES: hypothetical protein [unclassified Variovorax]|uniref:hypothetical protein n=2 Tax=Variovorax TaxID=34072 RepID=UPI000AC27164|nr:MULTISPECIES: hypothetical protein [unclassified Variovorax]PNG49843.1 hypothetical protein CHC06_05424 [Variovorax sp. B2]PNG50715.1 hypothetical protein CHC07_05329 [Variovorax sp. B4]VTV17911.1 hypothetical protein WDL1P1_00762 [Variovorax sp. WDL1]